MLWNTIHGRAIFDSGYLGPTYVSGTKGLHLGRLEPPSAGAWMDVVRPQRETYGEDAGEPVESGNFMLVTHQWPEDSSVGPAFMKEPVRQEDEVKRLWG